MSKTLFLARHAQSKGSNEGDDFHRDLTLIGMAESIKMGDRLALADIEIDHIIASSAIRTRMTAEVIASKLQGGIKISFKTELYNAPLVTLIKAIGLIPPQVKVALFIGHNPGLSYLATFLSDQSLDSFPPGAMVELLFTDLEWKEVRQGSAILKRYQTPTLT